MRSQLYNGNCLKNALISRKDEQTYIKKARVIQRLAQSNKQKLSDCIQLWREAKEYLRTKQNELKQQKKRVLSNLNAITISSNMGQVVKIIKLFEKNRRLTKISKNFLNRLMLTKNGKVLHFFSVMKTLPDAKLNKRKRKGIIFESRLHQFVLRRLRDTLNPPKDNTYQAQVKMKYCIRRLLSACMGETRRSFDLEECGEVGQNALQEGRVGQSPMRSYSLNYQAGPSYGALLGWQSLFGLHFLLQFSIQSENYTVRCKICGNLFILEASNRKAQYIIDISDSRPEKV